MFNPLSANVVHARHHDADVLLKEESAFAQNVYCALCIYVKPIARNRVITKLDRIYTDEKLKGLST